MELGTKWAGKQRSLKVGGDFTLKSETLSQLCEISPTLTYTLAGARKPPADIPVPRGLTTNVIIMRVPIVKYSVLFNIIQLETLQGGTVLVLVAFDVDALAASRLLKVFPALFGVLLAIEPSDRVLTLVFHVCWCISPWITSCLIRISRNSLVFVR